MKKHTSRKSNTASGKTPGALKRTMQLPELKECRFTELAVRILFGVLMALILAVLLFGSGTGWYIHVMDHASNSTLLAAGTGVLLLLLLLFYFLFRKDAGPKSRRTVLFLGLGFTVLQAVLIRSYYFRTAWDVNHMLSITEAILDNPGYYFESYYLSMYPNNRLLIWLFVLVGKIQRALAPGADLLYALILVQCAVCWISGVLVYDLAAGLCKSRAAAAWAYTVYLLIVGLSPWISIPYSDSFCLIFPLLTVFLYTRKDLRFQWGWIGITAVIGYYIKPQTLITGIAVLIVAVLKLLANIKVKNVWKFSLHGLFDCTVGVLAAALFVSIASASLPVEVDKTRVMGPEHYLMMGLNTASGGGYSDEDVELSYSITDVEAKHETELSVAAERLSEMGPEGLLLHLHNKLLSAYNDGTFFWGGEGMFYYQLYPETGSLSKLTRSIYYSDTGAYFPVYNNCAHALWIALLLFAGLLCFRRAGEPELILMLTVIGLTLFELLFEVRSRHLIAFIPVFILLASAALSGLLKFLPRNKKPE